MIIFCKISGLKEILDNLSVRLTFIFGMKTIRSLKLSGESVGYSMSSQFLSASLCLQLKKLWGKADPVQTKHQLFETKLLLQRGHVME